MNTSKIKTYAIQARRDFLKAVTERANIYGIFSDDHIDPIEFKGDMAIIGERAFPKKEGELREKLVGRIERDGFTMTMRACAYTWFNRFVALRYMEIHNYLEHGYRVLSHNGDSIVPEILEHAADVDFKGLDKEQVIELKLAGTKDNELYKLLIIAQCDQLHRSMSFLFDRIDNETELLLPDNLLHSDSPIQTLVTEIDESDWSDVEIIGWIYQFYISERKDEVIGKVVKTEDIPSATQLFTPNWIVKYMVQNTLGRMWLATYPDSSLRDKMEYYIEPSKQEAAVQEQLDATTPKELNPEEITFLDPACGSGHILVEAYDLLKEIYLERGYRTRDIPIMVLRNNLFGLDICDRAGQLACFSLLMKARADDRRILGRHDLKLNVMSIQESKDFDVVDISTQLTKEKVIRFDGADQLFPDFEGQMALKSVEKPEVSSEDIGQLLGLFKQGKTFGSLIAIPESLGDKMPLVISLIKDKQQGGDLFEREAAEKIKNIAHQALILNLKYHCVVTNPPYMGGKGMNAQVKTFLTKNYPDVKSDMFSAFIVRNIELVQSKGRLSFMSPFVWMFIASYEKLRKILINNHTIQSLVQLEYSGFEGATVPICTFTLDKAHHPDFQGTYIRLSEFRGAENQGPRTLEAIKNPNCGWLYSISSLIFNRIPGCPIAYWVNAKSIIAFKNKNVKDHFFVKKGMAIGNNAKYLRNWSEVSISTIFFSAKSKEDTYTCKWYPCLHGGAYKKWSSNKESVVNWYCNGQEPKAAITGRTGDHWSRYIISTDYFFLPGINWSAISSSYYSARYHESGFAFTSASMAAFRNDLSPKLLLLLVNSVVGRYFLSLLSPTLNYGIAELKKIPIIIPKKSARLKSLSDELCDLSKDEWDLYERSWDFKEFQLMKYKDKNALIRDCFSAIQNQWRNRTLEIQKLEEENNKIFIEAYGLEGELTPNVPISEITINCNPYYRYSANIKKDELESMQRTDIINELISYSIGCIMGRYSLDHPGLIYAHSGNVDFNPSKYKTFTADEDGIVPIMDQDWYTYDVTNRFVDFIKIAWPKETLDENLKFIADSLKPKRNEVPVDTIRRYMSTSFFKDHLKTYKKRPIYWLFSSGKQKAFECLVYLHRYNESTLSRMRSTYVTPLQSSFRSRLEFLQDEKDAVSTTSAKNKIQKAIDKLRKKQAELSAFDDELRHYADMKISLDLDDGVKVNYGRFGNLLAEKKAITGKK